jgi:small subunit ribosomal protein S20
VSIRRLCYHPAPRQASNPRRRADHHHLLERLLTLARTPRTWTGARTPSGLKRVRGAARRHEVLGPRRTAAKTLVKNAMSIAAAPNGADPQLALGEALSALDRAAKSGAIHKNAAARRKSRLTIKVNALLGGTSAGAAAAAKTVSKAAAQKAAKARIAAGKAGKAKGAQTAAGKARAALTKTSRTETATRSKAAAKAKLVAKTAPKASAKASAKAAPKKPAAKKN